MEKCFKTHWIILENSDELVALKHGLLGKSLYFYTIASIHGIPHYKEYASMLMQYIIDKTNINMPVTFMDGLTGIGWCIQYLISKHLEYGNADDILEELDNAVMRYNPFRFNDYSFESGLRGVVAYVRARLNRQGTTVPFDEKYISDLQNACAIYGINFHGEEFALDNVFSKILNFYASIPTKEQRPWETELLKLGNSLLDNRQIFKSISKEQDEFESEILKSEKPCVIVFTQTSRASNYGIGTYVKQLSRCLMDRNWDVCVIELDCAENESEFRINNGIGYYRLSQPNINYDLKQYNYAQYVINIFFNKNSKIVCHFNFVSYPHIADRLRKTLNAKIVFTLHYTLWSFDLLGDVQHLMKIINKQEDDRERSIYKTFLDEQIFMKEYCDSIIAIAKHSYDMLRDIYVIPESKLTLIPNGLGFPQNTRSKERRQILRKKYGFKHSEKLMVFCGRLDSIKGIVDLIDTFRVLSNRHKNVRLLIIGDGNFKVCLKCAKGLWNKITFTGYLEKETMMEIYEMSDIGIVPSIHEEFGYAALEMMSSGLPLVANNTTGLANLTENGKYGLLYNREHVFENDSLLNLLTRVILGSQMIPKADLKVLENTYSLAVFGESMSKLYNML